MKKILIIEDQFEDFELATRTLARYQVEVYPTMATFLSFSRLLVRYTAVSAQDAGPILDRIRQELSGFIPDFVFIDQGLDGRPDSADSSGLRLRDQFIVKEYPLAEIYLMSGKSGDSITRPDYLYKRATDSFEAQVVDKFIAVHQIPTVIDASAPDADASGAPAPATAPIYLPDPILAEIRPPAWLARFKRRKEHWWASIIVTLVDMVIMGIFYLLLAGLTAVGPWAIYQTAVKEHLDPLHLAETGFIAFLPLLVVFGYFSFYRRSLQPLLFGSSLDSVDYNRASELMTLSKKLFVSSLISYLFTKLIEMLFLTHLEAANRSEWRCSFFIEYFHCSDNPLLQVYLIAGAIAALIIFYIYLNSHKPTDHSVNK